MGFQVFVKSILVKRSYKTLSMLRLGFQRSCDHIQWFQWLQVVVHHGYVTLVWSHMYWSSHKYLVVLITGANVMHHLSVRPLYVTYCFLMALMTNVVETKIVG